MKKNIVFISLLLTFIVACSAGQETKLSSSAQSKPLPVKLPISSTKWSIWYCADGSTVRTRYRDNQQQALLLDSNGYGEQILEKELSTNPVIFSNSTIAFYSDGKIAAIGKPLSDEIYIGNCHP